MYSEKDRSFGGRNKSGCVDLRACCCYSNRIKSVWFEVSGSEFFGMCRRFS